MQSSSTIGQPHKKRKRQEIEGAESLPDRPELTKRKKIGANELAMFFIDQIE
jgi:hypothetical protein